MTSTKVQAEALINDLDLISRQIVDQSLNEDNNKIKERLEKIRTTRQNFCRILEPSRSHLFFHQIPPRKTIRLNAAN